MDFKKCISLVLVFFLLVSNTGLAFSAHFCEGKLASVSTAYSVMEACEKPEASSQKKCCASNADDHKKCCSDKEVELKKNAEEIVIKTFSFQIDLPCLVNDWKPLVFDTIAFSKSKNLAEYCCNANAPPLFKLYSQYILYA